jgi:hypothetical protein
LVHVSELQQEIYALKQDSRSVTEFYSELKILWEELEIYMPIHVCTCRNRCSCDVMHTARNNHHLLQAIRFLTGLNDNFAVVKSQILLLDLLPTMNKKNSMVLQHERQSSPILCDESKVLVNASDARKFASKSNKFGPSSYGLEPWVCTFCNRNNHIVDTCYRKHGLPPHLQRTNSS